MIVKLTEGKLETRFGTFSQKLYYDGNKECVALVMGEVRGAKDVFCRIHSSCISSHVFNSIECDCREQMEMAQQEIQKEGRGVIILLNQEGRNNGHMAFVASASLKEAGLSQDEAYAKLGYDIDAREYGAAAEIIKNLEVTSIVLLSNSPHKIEEIKKAGVSVSKMHGLTLNPDKESILYKTYKGKIARGHKIDLN